MNVLGTILAIALAVVLSIVLAPVGGIILLAATLVMALKNLPTEQTNCR